MGAHAINSTRFALAAKFPVQIPRVGRIESHTFVSNILSRQSTVVDLGVNEGRFALSIIREYGCRVIGVEPSIRLVQLLPKVPLLTVENAAIAAREGPVVLYENLSHCASTDQRLAEVEVDRVEVPGITLEGLLDLYNVRDIDLLKVDIEGAELQMLNGVGLETLLRCKQISVEYHDFLQPSLAADVFRADKRLRDAGFQRTRFSIDNTDVLYLHPLHRLNFFGTAVIIWYKLLRGLARRVRRRLALGTILSDFGLPAIP